MWIVVELDEPIPVVDRDREFAKDAVAENAGHLHSGRSAESGSVKRDEIVVPLLNPGEG